MAMINLNKLWISTFLLGASMLPVGQTSAWFLGVGHLPSCAYICLDRVLSLQSSCQDLRCICKNPNLLSATEACFRKECDLSSLTRALKLLVTCQESFGVTPAPAASPSPPVLTPPPTTGYPGSPYMPVPVPPTPNQVPTVPYYPYRLPGNGTEGAQYPPPGATVPLAGSYAPFPAPQPGVSVPQPQAPASQQPGGAYAPQPQAPGASATQPQAPAPQPQVLAPQQQAPAQPGGVRNLTVNSTLNSTTNPPAASPSPASVPLFRPTSNSSTTPSASDMAMSFSSAPSLTSSPDQSPIFLMFLFLAFSSTYLVYS